MPLVLAAAPQKREQLLLVLADYVRGTDPLAISDVARRLENPVYCTVQTFVTSLQDTRSIIHHLCCISLPRDSCSGLEAINCTVDRSADYLWSTVAMVSWSCCADG